MNEECGRARMWMAALVDGDLAPSESAWMGGHLESCKECHAVWAGFAEIDTELINWGCRLGLENPPAPLDKPVLVPARRRAVAWIGAGALVCAAAVVLAMVAPHGRTPDRDRAGDQMERPFIEIPYLAPLDPRENVAVVRMDIRVATLMAMGYRVAADPDTIVAADVLVGEDGRAHAVRVLSNIELNLAGGRL